MIDTTYTEVYKTVISLIKAPREEEIKASLTPLRGVLASTLAEGCISKDRISIPGWERFNKMLGGGIQEHQFTIICGPTGSGKTTLLANMACQFISNLVPIFVASVEVGSNDFARKMISIVTGKSADSDPQQVLKSLGKSFNTTNSMFTNYDSRVPYLQLLCDLYYAYTHHGVRVALIDNLNFLMDVKEGTNQYVEMDQAVHSFVVFCKKVPMHVFMIMHPRKTTDGRVDSEHDIKGSSTAVQEASNVILFNRLKEDSDAPYGVHSKLCREIKFAKVRNQGRSVGSKIIYRIDENSEMYTEVKLA